MTALLRTLRLLTMVVWVGGLIFFAFVVAPVAFNLAYAHELPSTHAAGLVVAGTLNVLNRMGLICGVVFVLASLPLWWKRGARRGLTAQLVLVMLMMATTAYVQASIIPAMERDRTAAGGEIESTPATNPARIDFERLHALSEKVEGAALFLGLGVVVLIGLSDNTAKPT